MLDVGVDPSLALLLVAISFLSGIGITTIGPGGIFVTIALYSLTSLSSGEVAGTAHATFVATGIVGSVVYLHSGELRARGNICIAFVLSTASIAGALSGAYVNQFVTRSTFGGLLGLLAVLVGGLILYRERFALHPVFSVDVQTSRGTVVFGALGFVLGVASGLLGVGGPVLAVPALILVGVPILSALAIAQVQSIFVAAFATVGYLSRDSVRLPLAVLIGLPLVAGVVVGWKIAHLIHPDRLKVTLGLVLIATGLNLVL